MNSRPAEGVGARTHFVGGVPRDELAGYYRTADLLLSLYDYSNLANPVIESMLLGCPPFALDVGGTSHLVHDGLNGVLLPEGDPVRIAGVVGSWLAKPAELRRLGNEAAAWASENLWSWGERMSAEIDRLDALMQRARRGSRRSRRGLEPTSYGRPESGVVRHRALDRLLGGLQIALLFHVADARDACARSGRGGRALPSSR